MHIGPSINTNFITLDTVARAHLGSTTVGVVTARHRFFATPSSLWDELFPARPA